MNLCLIFSTLCRSLPLKWQVLKAGEYKHAAQKGEHMSPLNVALWSICKSSLNVLKVCKSVASRYLASYAAGKEEHAEVSINTDNSHNVLYLQVQKIENIKLGGVRKILAREAKQEVIQGIIDSTTIASTECVSLMLQLPTVVTTMNFVSIPTVSRENWGRVVLKRKNNTQSRSNRPGVANEGPAEIREHHQHFPNHRRFTRGQKIVLDRVNKTLFSTVKVTVFVNCFLSTNWGFITGGSCEKSCQVKTKLFVLGLWKMMSEIQNGWMVKTTPFA